MELWTRGGVWVWGGLLFLCKKKRCNQLLLVSEQSVKCFGEILWRSPSSGEVLFHCCCYTGWSDFIELTFVTTSLRTRWVSVRLCMTDGTVTHPKVNRRKEVAAQLRSGPLTFLHHNMRCCHLCCRYCQNYSPAADNKSVCSAVVIFWEKRRAHKGALWGAEPCLLGWRVSVIQAMVSCRINS